MFRTIAGHHPLHVIMPLTYLHLAGHNKQHNDRTRCFIDVSDPKCVGGSGAIAALSRQTSQGKQSEKRSAEAFGSVSCS